MEKKESKFYFHISHCNRNYRNKASIVFLFTYFILPAHSHDTLRVSTKPTTRLRPCLRPYMQERQFLFYSQIQILFTSTTSYVHPYLHQRICMHTRTPPLFFFLTIQPPCEFKKTKNKIKYNYTIISSQSWMAKWENKEASYPCQTTLDRWSAPLTPMRDYYQHSKKIVVRFLSPLFLVVSFQFYLPFFSLPQMRGYFKHGRIPEVSSATAMANHQHSWMYQLLWREESHCSMYFPFSTK